MLALLLLTGWGQVHRVLHPGAAFPGLSATADAQVHKALAAGHEEGSGLCHLLDHLSQGSAPVSVWSTAAVMLLPQLQTAWAPRWRHVLVLAPFEARGPPPLA